MIFSFVDRTLIDVEFHIQSIEVGFVSDEIYVVVLIACDMYDDDGGVDEDVGGAYDGLILICLF